jgi:hypothetical protein
MKERGRFNQKTMEKEMEDGDKAFCVAEVYRIVELLRPSE